MRSVRRTPARRRLIRASSAAKCWSECESLQKILHFLTILSFFQTAPSRVYYFTRLLRSYRPSSFPFSLFLSFLYTCFHRVINGAAVRLNPRLRLSRRFYQLGHAAFPLPLFNNNSFLPVWKVRRAFYLKFLRRVGLHYLTGGPRLRSIKRFILFLLSRCGL